MNSQLRLTDHFVPDALEMAQNLAFPEHPTIGQIYFCFYQQQGVRRLLFVLSHYIYHEVTVGRIPGFQLALDPETLRLAASAEAFGIVHSSAGASFKRVFEAPVKNRDDGKKGWRSWNNIGGRWVPMMRVNAALARLAADERGEQILDLDEWRRRWIKLAEIMDVFDLKEPTETILDLALDEA